MDYELDAEMKMEKVIENLENKFLTVRAGRANPGMVNGIEVEYYGVKTPITSLANITVPEARQLFVKPFDRGALKDIERAINEANIGITPTNNGEIVILTVPELNEERRKEYVKLSKTYAEEAKVGLRNVRQEINNLIKKEEYPEDEEERLLKSIQNTIDKFNKIVDEMLKEKETELMQI